MMSESQPTPTQNVNFARLHKAVRQRLQSLKRAGLTHLNPPVDIDWNPSKLPNTLAQVEPPAAVTTPDPPPPDNIAADSTTHETPTLESLENTMPSKKQIQLDIKQAKK